MAEQWSGGLGCGGRKGKRGQAGASQGVDPNTRSCMWEDSRQKNLIGSARRCGIRKRGGMRVKEAIMLMLPEYVRWHHRT